MINGASAAVTGSQLVALARTHGVAAITLDQPVRLDRVLATRQDWPAAATAKGTWSSYADGTLPTPPAIAVVDSGIQANRADFGARV